MKLAEVQTPKKNIRGSADNRSVFKHPPRPLVVIFIMVKLLSFFYPCMVSVIISFITSAEDFMLLISSIPCPA